MCFFPLLYRLNVAFLPMLLHLHQCQLDFLVDFFGRKNSSNDQFPNNCHELEGSKSFPESKDHACHSIVQEALLPYFQASCAIKHDLIYKFLLSYILECSILWRSLKFVLCKGRIWLLYCDGVHFTII